ncbi:MAG TPA: PQQ-dependent sugar dehydrogenase, partial [Cyclobacteriaceae bacterium]
AHGIRNTVGFDWHPGTGELWFTDNGRDMLGDDIPPCELNKVSVQGQHFGYPYCHGGRYRDPEFGIERTCDEFVNPELNFIAHTAPLGMRFYSGNMFPSSYRNQILVAQHGSWNRSTKSGYKVLLVTVENNKAVKDEIFIEGWLNEATQAVWGRPVDILQLEDGSILISDDHAGLIYRVTYKG